MKLLLIGYCNLAEGFLGAANALKNIYGYEIEFFPFFTYRDMYGFDKVIDYIIPFINHTIKKEDVTYNSIITSDKKPDIVLWWCFLYDRHVFSKITSETNTMNIFYSWDDPYRIESLVNDHVYEMMDVCYTCCDHSKSFYEINGCKNVYYAAPGFDPSVHYPDEVPDPKYECDISIVCTNLYDKTNHTGFNVNRKILLDEIYKQADIKLHVYGSSFLAELYPECYKGFIPFDKTYKVFSNSKICLNTHVRRNGGKYINERTCQIMGSGGLLLIDDINRLDELMDRYKDCVILNEVNPVQQIRYILDNYDNYTQVRKNGYEHAMKNLTWDTWAEIVNGGIESKKSSAFVLRKQIITYEIDNNVISKLQIICRLINISHGNSKDYLVILFKTIEKYGIDVNEFLRKNIDRIIKKKFDQLII